jgi:hypothetical protein
MFYSYKEKDRHMLPTSHCFINKERKKKHRASKQEKKKKRTKVLWSKQTTTPKSTKCTMGSPKRRSHAT